MNQKDVLVSIKDGLTQVLTSKEEESIILGVSTVFETIAAYRVYKLKGKCHRHWFRNLKHLESEDELSGNLGSFYLINQNAIHAFRLGRNAKIHKSKGGQLYNEKLQKLLYEHIIEFLTSESFTIPRELQYFHPDLFPKLLHLLSDLIESGAARNSSKREVESKSLSESKTIRKVPLDRTRNNPNEKSNSKASQKKGITPSEGGDVKKPISKPQVKKAKEERITDTKVGNYQVDTSQIRSEAQKSAKSKKSRFNKRITLLLLFIIVISGIAYWSYTPPGITSHEARDPAYRVHTYELIGSWSIQEQQSMFYMFNSDSSGIYYRRANSHIVPSSIVSFSWKLSSQNDAIILTTNHDSKLWVWDLFYSRDDTHILENDGGERRTLTRFVGRADEMEYDSAEKIASRLAAVQESRVVDNYSSHNGSVNVPATSTQENTTDSQVAVEVSDLLTLWDRKRHSCPSYEFFENGRGVKHQCWDGGKDPHPRDEFIWELEEGQKITIHLESQRDPEVWTIIEVSKNEMKLRKNGLYQTFTWIRHNLIIDEDVMNEMSSTASRPFNMQERALREFHGFTGSQNKLSPKFHNLVIPYQLQSLIMDQTLLRTEEFMIMAGFEYNQYRNNSIGEKPFINVYDGSEGQNSYTFEDIYIHFDFDGFLKYRGIELPNTE